MTSLKLDLATAIGEQVQRAVQDRIDRNRYKADPVAFGRDKLGLDFTAKQEEVLRALCQPPHRVMVKSANNVGKSFISAFACVWFYRTRDPASVLLTAPTFAQVSDVTFKEIRRLMGNHPDLYPKAPRAQDHAGHLMNGFTAGSATAFQGRREDSNLLVFEESMGIGPEFWVAARFMLSGGTESFWLSIHNPTDNTGHAYTEEMSGTWHVITITAFEHPNILAEAQGLPAPFPSAVRLGQLKDNLDAHGNWLPENETGPLDVDCWDAELYEVESLTPEAEAGLRFHFPRRWWRPKPEGDSRILGRYPSQSATSVFSEAAFNLAESLAIDPGAADKIVIGCDVARFGDDDTTIHARRGLVSLEHQTFHGQDTAETAGRLKEMCRRLGKLYSQTPTSIRVNVDDTGVGGGVVDQRTDPAYGDVPAQSFNFVPINNGCTAAEPDRFPNVRSELLITLSERMSEGQVDLSRLPDDVKKSLRYQALQVIYKMDARGRRVVEEKSHIKARLGRSPDDLDAFALCHYMRATGQITGAVTLKTTPFVPGEARGRTPTHGPLAASANKYQDMRNRK